VEQAIDIGPGKGHMVALSADGGTAWVTKVGSGALVRVDLAAATSAGDDAARAAAVREAPAGGGAEGIDVAPDGTVWVSNREDGTVPVHDPDSLAVLATLPSPGFPIRLVFTPDGRHALVTNARAATLSVFDAATREAVATVPLEPEGVQLHDTLLGHAALPIGAIADPAGGRVFVAVSGAAPREAVATVRLEPEGVQLHATLLGHAALPIGAIADPAGGRVFVAVSGADRIAVVDTASWTVTAYWETGREPDALAIVAP